ncbi:MAG: LysM peptidoglycan-binding domain-containing protein [Candidatus Shapirobacteria bacterium]|jgi:nucleoid-associated protein YgaU
MNIKNNEDVISMFLGLLVVVAVAVVVVNYFQKQRGSVSVPGTTSELALVGEGSLEEKVEEKKEVKLTAGEYMVKKGDSLWKIAVAQLGDGYKWTEIAQINGLKNPSLLAVGQVLKISAPAEEMVDYQVKNGDSLWKIAVTQYGDGFKWTEIWNLNRVVIPNPNMIRVGTVLRMVK